LNIVTAATNYIF